MNIDEHIGHQLNIMESICLSEINKVKLMRRKDTKYVFHLSELPAVLESLQNNYFVIEIDGIAVQQYRSVYFDTKSYFFYLQHHNKRQNRYKVRFRTYVNSNLSFLEVKHKTNRKETIKNRIEQAAIPSLLDKDHMQFIHENIGGHIQQLYPSLENSFKRITLVSKVLNERITIDTDLNLYDTRTRTEHTCENLCIIETKRDFHNKNTHSYRKLMELQIKPSGFSKYCMGLALTNQTIKKNLFKPRLIKYQSILN